MTFERFLDVMTATHLSRIRDPAETAFPLFAWVYPRRIPASRWALAHFLLTSGARYEFRYADGATELAYELLCHRARKTIPIPGVKPLIDAILIYERDDWHRWLLEAHLLLPELPPNLSQKLGLAQETIDYYALWFFDVRHRLSKSSWIFTHAMGRPGFDGYADDELEPVWKRFAYRGSEQALDAAVSLTTGVGVERYGAEVQDTIAFEIENLRLSLIREPERVLQIERRLRAEDRGEHPSCYHIGRCRRVEDFKAPEASEGLRDSELRTCFEAIGERAFV